jgi:hypothetical protein
MSVNYELIKKEVRLRADVMAMGMRIHDFLVEAGYEAAWMTIEKMEQCAFGMVTR